MRIGFVGCGTIAAAMVEGLVAAGREEAIIVSPRNAATAAALAARFANVRVAATNQAVLDASDLVILSVRPQIAAEVIADLRFRPDHRVLSLIAATSLAELRRRVAPAGHVVRAVPVPSVARRQGPTAFFPPDENVRALFDALGVAIALDDESQFDTFTSATAAMASHFAFADAIAGWMTREGVPADSARAYVGTLLGGLAATAAAAPETSFAALADEHQTKGGLNEQVRESLARTGAFEVIGEALDAVQKRLRDARQAG